MLSFLNRFFLLLIRELSVLLLSSPFLCYLPDALIHTSPYYTLSFPPPTTTCRVRPWLVPKSRLYPQSDLLYYYELTFL